MHLQLGQIYDKKIQKDKTKQNKTKHPTTSEELRAKQGVGRKTEFWSKGRELHMSPALATTKAVGKTPEPPLALTPGHTPTLSPCKEPACLTSISKPAKEPVVFS